MRSFYRGDDKKDKSDYKRLKGGAIIDDLLDLAEFWKSIHRRDENIENKEAEKVSINLEAFQYLHCLSLYTNEYWKHVTSVFLSYLPR